MSKGRVEMLKIAGFGVSGDRKAVRYGDE